jgi:hypothetical protein
VLAISLGHPDGVVNTLLKGNSEVATRKNVMHNVDLLDVKEVLSKKRRDHCKFVLLESGEPIVRRIHRLVIQAANGKVYEIEGKDLPLYICLSTGHSQDGKHVGQILLNPNQYHALDWIAPTTWLSLRTVGVFAFGMLVAHLLWTVNHAVEVEKYHSVSQR